MHQNLSPQQIKRQKSHGNITISEILITNLEIYNENKL